MRLAVVAAAAVLLLAGLGRIDAWAPDEPRYLQVAEEARSLAHGPGGLVLLHLDGEPYTQKPPLYFWLAALGGAPTGRVGELAARLPSALAGIGVVVLTLLLGGRLLGGRVGVVGAALLLTVFEFANLSRRIQLDVLLTLFETAALVLFWRIDRALGPRVPQVLGLHALLGLAVLTKGPVGFLVPVLVMATFLVWERRARDLLRVLPAWALPLSVLPGVVWIVAATSLAPTGFADEAVVTNLIGRFFEGTSHARPPWYFLYQLPIDFLPWTALWPAVFWAARRNVFAPGGAEPGERRAWRFLLAWVGASFVFFSLSAGKRGLYLLPAFPALALLCADALTRVLVGRTSLPRGLGAPLAVLATLLTAAAVAAVVGPTLLANHERVAPLLEAIDPTWLLAFGCGALGVCLAAAAAWLVTGRMRIGALRRIAVVVAGIWALELAIFLLLYPALDPGRSPRPIAEAAAAVTPEAEPIGLVGDRALRGGLVYYGGRSVVPLSGPETIRAFFAGGGHTIVVQTRKAHRVTDVQPMRVAGRSRTGRRELLVLVPGEGGASPPVAEAHGASRRRAAP